MRLLADGSLRPLINPRADQTNLLGRERPDVRLVMQRRHPQILVGCHVGDAPDERAFSAVTGDDDLAILAAFERVFKAVELQFGFWFVATVTFDAGVVEHGLDVGGISNTDFC